MDIFKEFKFSDENLSQLSAILEFAKTRDDEMMKYPFIMKLNHEELIALTCPSDLPKQDGKGCFIRFKINDYLSIQKSLDLGEKIFPIIKKIRFTDPNETSDHLHFPSLIDESDSSSTHFFCKPEGKEGNKVWGCYWYIHESIKN